MTNPKLSGVLIDKDEDGHFIVKPIWNDVDRPYISGYSTGKNRKLAERLQQAFKDGAAYENARITADVDSRTYVTYDFKILMRQANADLKRLGY